MRQKVLEFLQHEVDSHHIPGAVVHVSYQGEVVMQEAVGYQSVYPEKEPVKLDTVFDIASLTKVVATLPAVLRLLEQGKLSLNDPVQRFLPGFQEDVKPTLTVKHLLTHTSGLPAHRPYHKEKLNASEVLERIYHEELAALVGEDVMYSDLNFITLFHLIEQITGESFETFVQREIFQPLGMNETGFLPNFPQDKYAATEYDEALKDYKRGIVHDENAESMGGVSGHAGLFSTVKDLAKYAQMIEKEGILGCNSFLSKASIQLSRKSHTPQKESRGLGWVLNDGETSCGDLFSMSSYGHTGFTGTSLWFDPEEKLHVILLTNRVHFGRKDPIKFLRPRLHNLIRANI